MDYLIEELGVDCTWYFMLYFLNGKTFPYTHNDDVGVPDNGNLIHWSFVLAMLFPWLDLNQKQIDAANVGS